VAKSGMPTLQRRRSPSNIARKADFRAVIDGIAAAANEMIDALLKRSSGKVDLTTTTPARRSGRRRVGGQANSRAA